MIFPLLAAAAAGGNANRTHANARKRIRAPHRRLGRMTAPGAHKKKIRPPRPEEKSATLCAAPPATSMCKQLQVI
jgi:hypothetical protein